MMSRVDLSTLHWDAGKLRAYLRRIGLSQQPEASFEGLSELHLAHILSIPFENLDIHLGKTISLRTEDLFSKIVRGGRGGFCYEQNLIFATALQALGFEVDLLSAQVHDQKSNFGPPFDHMVIRVVLGDQILLADVGFGECFREPVPMNEEWCQQIDGSRYRLASRGDGTFLEHTKPGSGKVIVDYRLDLTPRAPDEYESMCAYHQTSRESHFTRAWVCSLTTTRGRITAKPGVLVQTDGTKRIERPITSLLDLQGLLRVLFGMSKLRLPPNFPWRQMP